MPMPLEAEGTLSEGSVEAVSDQRLFGAGDTVGRQRAPEVALVSSLETCLYRTVFLGSVERSWRSPSADRAVSLPA